MKEDFLHYLWRTKNFKVYNLKTFQGSPVEIINFGKWNLNAGPDFYEVELVINQQLWIGTVEMHVNSSDWDLHQHSSDEKFHNVILHVVWNHDKEIISLRSKNVETLILSDFVDQEKWEIYEYLMKNDSNFLLCKSYCKTLNWDKIGLWFDRLLIDRIEEKSKSILELYSRYNQNWEEVTFRVIASNFGLKINSTAFEIWSTSFPFTVLQKIQHKKELVEALFFGQAGFLNESTDNYSYLLNQDYQFLKSKYKLNSINKAIFKFSSLRPISFPTIRLAQMAALYGDYNHLFSYLIGIKSSHEFYVFFKNLELNEYWNTHYTFGKESKFLHKRIATTKIDNLIINTILPLKFAYERLLGKIDIEFYQEILEDIKPESNSIIDTYQSAGFIINSAKDSQVILHLKKRFCDEKKCLNCAIGTEVLKR